mmetsp:Transcript_29193/g.70069  ORF Transcript_29193/g.70069 Transcript_29193/m.70069 type:complete len:200 (-) Transcript_29193:1044-1643(-)
MVEGAAHDAPDDPQRLLRVVLGAFQDELVVNLEHQLEPELVQAGVRVHLEHRNNSQVSGAPLNHVVHSRPRALGFHSRVAVRCERQRPPPPQQAVHLVLLPRHLLHPPDPLLGSRPLPLPLQQQLLRRLRGDPQALRQGRRPLAVQDAEIDHLGSGALAAERLFDRLHSLLPAGLVVGQHHPPLFHRFRDLGEQLDGRF